VYTDLEAKMEIPVKYVRCSAGRPRNTTAFAFFSLRITISLRGSGKKGVSKKTQPIGSAAFHGDKEMTKLLIGPRCVGVLVVGLARLYRC